MLLSLAIQKGGSGKTTTAINLAAALQQMGKTVLLVDLDPQANLTQALGLGDETEPSIYHLLKQEMEGRSAQLADIVQDCGGLPLVPASLELAGAELELVSVYGREQLLRRMLAPLQDQYDYILLDCPPAIGLLTVNALAVSDYVLVPLQAEFLPLKGLQSFLRHLETIKRSLNPRVEVLGLLLSRYDPRKKMHQQIREQLDAAYPGRLFDTYIRTNIALAQAQAAGQDIFSFDPASNGAEDYMFLAGEAIGRMLNR
jgi:chromosome partitioning protein